MSGGRGLLSAIEISIGRWLGRIKQENKDMEILDEWRALCAARGWKITDRILDLLAFDLQENGVELNLIRAARENSGIAQAQEENALANEFIRRTRELAKQLVDTELKATQEKLELTRYYEAELNNLRNLLQKARSGD